MSGPGLGDTGSRAEYFVSYGPACTIPHRISISFCIDKSYITQVYIQSRRGLNSTIDYISWSVLIHHLGLFNADGLDNGYR